MIARIAIAGLALIASGAGLEPASAQKRERYIQIFGNDRCPPSTEDEAIICGKLPESERFRIPEQFREPTAADRVAKDERVTEMVYAGRTGTQSCSPVGPGGFTGCQEQLARAWREDRKARARARADSTPD